MVKDVLKELRALLDVAIESEHEEDAVRLREGLEAALIHIKTDDSWAGDTQDLDLIIGAWRRGTVPPGVPDVGESAEKASAGLIRDILAVQEFALALSKGDLSRPLHAKGAMVGSLKTLQANLRHLTWQTQVIAKGDFSQRVDFMGDFSESFNLMVSSLADMRDALEQGKREIEMRVEERTEELSRAYKVLRAETQERQRVEKELRRAQKLEALGTLSGGIAHDFNNILAGIIGFTEMVLDQTPSDAPTRRKLELIHKSGVRGRELVKQILAFSRGANPEKRQIALGTLIEESLRLLGPVLPPGTEIRKNVSSVRETISVDPDQVHQVIMNLCTNAAHAMQGKEGLIEVGLADRELADPEASALGLKEGPYAEISVRDTGCGIEKESLEKIFDPFFTTKRPGQGTGMGLSVVHGIVKGHGGSITVQTEPGEGSIFRVLLPASAVNAGAVDAVPGRIERGKERILFVDDEEELVEMNGARLKNLGYKVESHSDPAAAIDAFRSNPAFFDLVITDFAMPDMTGIEFARKIHEIRADVPILLFSGFNQRVDAGTMEEAGINASLDKTANKGELAAAVRRVLGA
ncbi:MAG TPA: ATP-binding protein [Syntrophorhabdaceae bacterium]|jgi:signal transduction histidine kinase/CheY-like chemotaxis protein